MAESSNNVLTYGLSGTVGGMLVFRKYGDKVIVAKRPAKRTSEFKESEKEVQKRFKEAAAYAKAAIENEALKALYKTAAKGKQSAYNIAFADYFTAPEIKEVSLDQYSGQKGDQIRIRAIDDFKVVSVKLEIYDSSSSLVESGEAASPENGLDWIYKAKAINANANAGQVKVYASDMAGNITLLEVEL